jgi:hypothetical protein
MVSVVSVVFVVIVAFAAWIVLRRRGRGRTQTEQLSPASILPETIALEAFTHGNSCLAEGKFAEASAAFHRALELDPKRPHVAARLAEVARRQQEASATLPASAPPNPPPAGGAIDKVAGEDRHDHAPAAGPP